MKLHTAVQRDILLNLPYHFHAAVAVSPIAAGFLPKKKKKKKPVSLTLVVSTQLTPQKKLSKVRSSPKCKMKNEVNCFKKLCVWRELGPQYCRCVTCDYPSCLVFFVLGLRSSFSLAMVMFRTELSSISPRFCIRHDNHMRSLICLPNVLDGE